jgi:hypothetical protein
MRCYFLLILLTLILTFILTFYVFSFWRGPALAGRAAAPILCGWAAIFFLEPKAPREARESALSCKIYLKHKTRVFISLYRRNVTMEANLPVGNEKGGSPGGD